MNQSKPFWVMPPAVLNAIGQKVGSFESGTRLREVETELAEFEEFLIKRSIGSKRGNLMGTEIFFFAVRWEEEFVNSEKDRVVALVFDRQERLIAVRSDVPDIAGWRVAHLQSEE